MFGTYLLRELANRRKQTTIIAIGMALAIALVVVLNAVSAGVREAQSRVLESIYGVGTDLTVTGTFEPGEGGTGPQTFTFGRDDGETAEGTTELSQSRLVTARGSVAMDASTIETVASVDGVASAAGTLSLENMTFSGAMPAASDDGEVTQDMVAPAVPGTGGADGAGGSEFGVDTFSVEGVDSVEVGPLSATELVDGRMLEDSDAGAPVAVLDQTYASSEDLAVGDTVTIAGEEFEVVGIVASATADAATASDAYIPLDVAQELADLDDQVTTVYVQADSASSVDAVSTALESELPDATVSTQADLASNVSGSLSTASTLIANLGAWLSLLVLAAAFLLAILFTISGVTRRTREFGTLKAIGWSNGRIVRQVAGESLVQGLLGGALGIALGFAAVLAINLAAPSLTAGESPLGGLVGPSGPMTETAAETTVTLSASVTPIVLLLAVGLAVLGGLLAGAFGGWRAARLRPAEALRSVA